MLSGKEVCDILSRHAFAAVRQRGSHIVMQKTEQDTRITVPVPHHRELTRRTLSGIIRRCQLPQSLFESPEEPIYSILCFAGSGRSDACRGLRDGRLDDVWPCPPISSKPIGKLANAPTNLRTIGGLTPTARPLAGLPPDP